MSSLNWTRFKVTEFSFLHYDDKVLFARGRGKCITYKLYNKGFVAKFNAPINVLPHHPPLGRKWGFTGGIDTKLLPHYGASDDRSVSAQIFFVVTSFAMLNPK